MSISTTPLPESYDEMRYRFIKQVEESGSVSLAPYIDDKGIPTLGLGFNLQVHLDRIMGKFGIDLSNPAEAKYIGRIRAIVGSTYADTAQEEAKLQANLDKVMDDRLQDAAIPGPKRAAFAFNDEAEVKVVFVDIANDIYEPKIAGWETTHNLGVIPNSYERLALFSLAYNTKDGKTSLLGNGLAQAIANGDRAEAWYEIRYNSNSDNSPGVAKRRYEEAALFGLYYDISPEESKQAFRMLQLHRDWIRSREQSAQISAANADLQAAGMSQVAALPLQQELEPARVELVGNLNSQYAGLSATEIDNISAERIFLDPGRASNSVHSAVGVVDPNHSAELNSRANAQTGLTDANDLLIGEAGNDRLLAGGGNDILIGGAGEDLLAGDAGVDEYVFSPNEGNDTIIDADRNGRIRVGAALLSGVDATSFEHTSWRSRPAWHVQTANGDFDFILVSGDVVNGGKLRIEGTGIGAGSSITIENFHQGDLGLFFPLTPRAAVLPGVIASTSPWTDPTFVPTPQSTNLSERSSRNLSLALSLPASQGQVVRISVSALQDNLKLVNGADTLSFNADGTLNLTLEAGQSVLNFALLAQGDVDASTAITLTATLLDSQGNPIGAASDLNIAFNAVAETGSITTFTGDLHIIDFDPDSPGVQPHYDEYGNRITDGTPEPIQDQLNGSFDNTTIIGGALGDILKGQTGDDQIFADLQVDIAAAIANGALGGGSPRPMVLSSSNNNDILSGGAGRDTVVGSNAGDVVSGGWGDDLVIAGQGSDFVLGDTVLDASSFNWTLTESPAYTWSASGSIQWIYASTPELGGNDVIYAGSGDDEVIAGFGDDLAYGESGNDHLAGGGGNDTLLGGADNDLLQGDQDLSAFYAYSIYGSDFLDGGAGDDDVRGQGGADVLFGGADNDFLYGDGLDEYGADDYLNGESGNDVLHGRAGADTLIGADGADSIYGDAPETAATNPEYEGDDHLDGGAGDDQLVGLGGSDTLLGGADNDMLFGDSLGTTEASQGDDYLDGGVGDDQLQGDGGSDTLFGGLGADTLIGDASSTPEGVQGSDYLDGGDGIDQLYGRGGADTLIGGLGDDTLYGDDSSTPVAAQLGDHIDGGEGNDILGGAGGADTLIGGAGNDYLYGEFSDTPASAAGDDHLEGGDGDDTLLGEGGNDTLLGGAGTDILSGGSGDDYFETGSGNDTLFGGAGNDTFVISADAGNVQIVDNEGVNTVIYQGAGSASDFDVGFSGNWTLIYTSPTTYIAVQGDAATALGAIQLQDGTSLSADSVLHAYQPGSVGTDHSISLLNGVAASEISATRWNDDLVLSYGGTQSDWVGLSSLQARGVGARLVPGEQYGLSAGTKALVLINWYQADPASYVNHLLDGASNSTDLLPIASAASVMRAGGSGDDVVDGTAAAETLLGFAGSDVLGGGAGDDTYVFNTGDGADLIEDSAGANDVVRFGSGITVANLAVSESNEGLRVVVGAAGQGDAVTIANWSQGGGQSIDGFVFADGATLDRAQIDALNTGNHSPRVTGALTNQNIRVGQTFSYVVPQGVFSDSDVGDTLTYFAYQSDWSLLPAWLTFDAQSRTFSGVPTSGSTGTSSISLFGVDVGGLWNTVTFDVRVTSAMVLTGTASSEILSAPNDGNDYEIYGLAGDDALHGNGGNDLLVGGAGNDFLWGRGGNDIYAYQRGDGNDSINASDDAVGTVDTLRFGTGIAVEDVVFGANYGGDLVIRFRNADGSISATDSIRVQSSIGQADSYQQSSNYRIERFEFADGRVLTSSEVTALATATATDQDDWIIGTASADVLSGAQGRDHVFGAEGDDTLIGGAGDDLLEGGIGSDTYVYNIGDGKDVISSVRDAAPSSTDAIVFGAGILPSDVSVGRHLANSIIDYLFISVNAGGLSGSVELSKGLATYGSELLDEIRFADGTVWTRADINAASLIGGSAGESIDGYASNDVMRGNGGNDVLRGLAGNDSIFGGDGSDFLGGDDGDDELIGGSGNDQLSGGLGNDIYRFGAAQGFDEIADTSGINRILLDAGIAPAAVTVYRTSSTSALGWISSATTDDLVLVVNGGSDQLRVLDYYAGQTPRPIDQVVFADGTVWDGSAIDSRAVNIAGTANTFTGTTSNNSYTVDHPNDVINEPANGGTDSVSANVSFTLPTNVENLTLTGPLNINGTGNTSANTITGNSLDNVLDGRAGADNLFGGAGNDTFAFYDDNATDAFNGGQGDDSYYIGIEGTSTNGYANDSVSEAANEGFDTIYTSAWAITLSANVESVVFRPVAGSWSGSLSQFTILGNGLDNYIDASANNAPTNPQLNFIIDGGVGADTMIAVTGRVNRILVDNTGDVVLGADADDTVVASVSYTLGGQTRTLELSGSAAISGTGNSGANLLNGATNSGANTLAGLSGDDEYVIDVGDVVVEAADGGTDTVRVTFVRPGSNSHQLDQYANLENLTALDGAGAATLVGSSASNRLAGNAYANVLNGGAGDDTLTGGAGDDSYVVFNGISGNDVISDTSGSDTIEIAAANLQPGQLDIARSGDDLVISTSSDPSSAVRVQSWYSTPNNGSVVERLTLNNQGLQYAYTSDQLAARAAGVNGGPAVSAAIADAAAPVGQAFSLQLASNTFSDLESQQSLSYSARLEDGSALPGWLVFDPTKRTFSGTPAVSDAAALLIRVTATDGGGSSVSDDFVLDVGGTVRNGTTADDSLMGDARPELLRGFEGNDTLQGAAGNDRLMGGRGDDVYILDGTSGNDVIAEDEGLDRIEFASTSGVGVTDLSLSRVGDNLRIGYLGNSMVVENHYIDEHRRLEEVATYDSGVRYIYSVAQLEALTNGQNTAPYAAMALDDRATRANTTWTYQVPANTFSDTQSQASLAYSARLVGGAALPSWLAFNPTTRTLTGKAPNGTSADYAIEIVAADPAGLVGTTSFTLRVRSSLSTWTGTANADVTSGTTGADYQLGLAGNDTLRGNSGNDIQDAGDGNDSVQGEIGDDVLLGGAGDDTLEGGDGLDSLYGAGGRDHLLGGIANDTLSGGRGDDVLNGGSGSDGLIGGNGADSYIYSLADVGGSDIIDNTSSDSERDKIVLSDISRSQLSFVRSGISSGLLIYTGANLIAEVANWFANPNNRVDAIETADGLVTTADDIDALIAGGGRTFPSLVADDATQASMQPATLSSEAILDGASEQQSPAELAITQGSNTNARSNNAAPELASIFAPTSIAAPEVVQPVASAAPQSGSEPQLSSLDWRGVGAAMGSADDRVTIANASIAELMDAAPRFGLVGKDIGSFAIRRHGFGWGVGGNVVQLDAPQSTSLVADRQLTQLIAAMASFANAGASEFALERDSWESLDAGISLVRPNSQIAIQ